MTKIIWTSMEDTRIGERNILMLEIVHAVETMIELKRKCEFWENFGKSL